MKLATFRNKQAFLEDLLNSITARDHSILLNGVYDGLGDKQVENSADWKIVHTDFLEKVRASQAQGLLIRITEALGYKWSMRLLAPQLEEAIHLEECDIILGKMAPDFDIEAVVRTRLNEIIFGNRRTFQERELDGKFLMLYISHYFVTDYPDA